MWGLKFLGAKDALNVEYKNKSKYKAGIIENHLNVFVLKIVWKSISNQIPYVSSKQGVKSAYLSLLQGPFYCSGY
jgi:hypothetical protein